MKNSLAGDAGEGVLHCEDLGLRTELGRGRVGVTVQRAMTGAPRISGLRVGVVRPRRVERGSGE